MNLANNIISPVSNTVKTAPFDYFDVYILSNSLSMPQLRNEVHQADIKAAISELFTGTPYEDAECQFPWTDFAQCCREAIEAIRERGKRHPLPALPGKRIDIDGIKDHNDIYSVVEGYIKLSQPKGNRATGKCPMHESKGNPLTVYLDERSWYCFHCNKGGGRIRFYHDR